MSRWVGICFFVLSGAIRSHAIDAAVSHALFYKPDSLVKDRFAPHVEIYWQINPRTLHFVTNGEKKIIARIKADIQVTNSGTLLVDDHFILQTSPKQNAEDLGLLSILEVRKYKLTAGRSYFSVRFTDVNDSNNSYTYKDSADAVFDPAAPFYSDVQFLDTAFRSDAKTPFARNGRQQLPLCADFVDDHKRTFHYYTELYNLQHIPPARYPLMQRARISKKENETYIPGFEKTDTFLNGNLQFTSGAIPIGKLTSGNYYLSMSVEDKFGIVMATKSRFFQRLNAHPEKDSVTRKPVKEIFRDTGMENVTVLNLEKTFMAKYTLAQVRAMLKMLLPVSDQMQTNTINNFLKKPDEMYMRYYIYNHFLDINKDDPARAWKEYSDIVKEVNKRFTEQGTAGYETDRGFIYLRYGKPTEIITVAGETGALPYEVWQYNTLTQFSNRKELPNALFLFYKPAQMMTEYRLLHSTVPGEAVNMSWRMYLYATANGAANAGFNMNSRAEQYFGNR